MDNPILEVRDLHKKFGGLAATAGVSLQVQEGKFHAIIGPNGAGKSTFLAQLIGEVRPDSGRILFKGIDVTAWPTPARVKAGMSRSFQVTSLCLDLSVMQNVLLASQLRRGGWTGFWRRADSFEAARKRALEELDRVGLADRADANAGALSHGEHRQLEVATALASDPQLVLLDEPLAGLGHEEAEEMVVLLDRLKGSVTVILIEHDMSAIFSLADHISVLNFGRLIASGDVNHIRNHPLVREAYLGEDKHA
ncbi:MAG: ABC transporter ATP-binding protein [Rhizobiaceae bacterium]